MFATLAVSRSLGDKQYKVDTKFVSNQPSTASCQLRPKIDKFMILACDGLWDVMKYQANPRFVAFLCSLLLSLCFALLLSSLLLLCFLLCFPLLAFASLFCFSFAPLLPFASLYFLLLPFASLASLASLFAPFPFRRCAGLHWGPCLPCLSCLSCLFVLPNMGRKRPNSRGSA